MKKLIVLIFAAVVLAGFVLGWGNVLRAGAEFLNLDYDNPDIPSHLKAGVSREEFHLMRASGSEMKRGINNEFELDPQARPKAIDRLEKQERSRLSLPRSRQRDSLLAAWTPIGPAPIPNAQVGTAPVTTASGRVLSIAVHPTNPDIVYVGTAQGGLYRSTNGGTSWTPLMDSALSLAIGALALAPSNPEVLYVGTGEPGFCGSCFFGVGVYRIDNPSTVATLSGPFNRDGLNNDVLTGRGIGNIMVHPTDPNTIFVASTSGVGGRGGASYNLLPSRGLFRSTNAQSANATFSKLTGLIDNGNASVRDIAIDPSNADILLANVIASGGAGGLYRSTNALNADPATVTFSQTEIFNATSTSELTGEFAAIHPAGDDNATFYAAVGNLGGRLLKSVDGGATWTQQIDNDFCTPQCFYDIAVAVDPSNAANVYLAGSPTLAFGRSITSGTIFTPNALTARGLHVDSHVIAVAPSNPSIVYFGSDGGIYRTNDVQALAGIDWTSLNNSTFSATQFMSLAVHPTDANFTIGGTQDNGTHYYDSAGNWLRVDGGDGGFASIDQNAVNTANVRMYHAYFTRGGSQVGYVTRAASTGSWLTRGCFGSSPNHGIGCDPTILFYAPLEQGPGAPNSVYFGSDRLYRSADSGTTHTVVSQAPIQANVPISAIGISPQDDNVRIVGLSNGALWGTTTGSAVMTDMDPLNQVPSPGFIGRIAIDPQNSDTAYVTLANFGVNGVYRSTNLSAAQPTWTGVSSGLPQVPVSAFVIDPANPTNLYAGTDIGVYASFNSGTIWAPLGTGLPRVAVFDMAIQPTSRTLRIATHGRGIWQMPLAIPTFSVGGGVTTPDGRGLRNAVVSMSNASFAQTVTTSSFGFYQFSDIPAGDYTVAVRSRRYRFSARSESINSSLSNIDFFGQE
ncbi:MAG: carboxypeptidase regulatory-like domain-containing protein [Pyrinomonadaceae bacterium]